MTFSIATSGTVDEIRDRAQRWAGLLAAAVERRDYSAAQGYARHLEAMTAALRRLDR